MLDSLYLFHDLDQRSCSPVDYQDLLRLVNLILHNPNFGVDQYQIHALYHAAIFSEKLGLTEAALEYLKKAESIDPTIMPILKLQVEIYKKNALPDQALSAIERRLSQISRQKISAADLDWIAAEIQTIRTNSRIQPGGQ